MKKNISTMALVSLFTVVAICSCNKDEDENGGNGLITNNTITVAVENGNKYNDLIDVVKVEMDDEDDNAHEIASAEYSNGGYTLKLPASVSDRNLIGIDEDIPDGVKVSNASVKLGWTSTYAYQSGDVVGRFYHGTSGCEGELVYASGDLTITGSTTITDEMTYTMKYNVKLKKG
jgi:hypothetical protein